MPLLRVFTTAPAWAAHFHADGPDGRSVACFDARCGVAPLATSDAAPASPGGGMPQRARTAAPARRRYRLAGAATAAG